MEYELDVPAASARLADKHGIYISPIILYDLAASGLGPVNDGEISPSFTAESVDAWAVYKKLNLDRRWNSEPVAMHDFNPIDQSLLLVTPDDDHAKQLKRAIETHGIQVKGPMNCLLGLELAAKHDFDVAIITRDASNAELVFCLNQTLSLDHVVCITDTMPVVVEVPDTLTGEAYYAGRCPADVILEAMPFKTSAMMSC